LLVDLAGTLPGRVKFPGLWEWLAEAGGRVLYFAARKIDVGERLGLGRFEPGQTVLQSRD
jgi:hypothetical protein